METSIFLDNLLIALYSGVKLHYLPPYLPDLNPIEECFSFVKAYLCRHGQAYRSLIEVGDKVSTVLLLYKAISTVTADHCRAWFHHSGYL